MSDLSGHRVGVYELQTPIERGRWTGVYEALDLERGHTLALKAFHGGPVQLPDFETRFLALMEAVSALEHPHILPVWDYGIQEGVPYLTMPYLSRGSLVGWLHRKGRVEVRIALAVLEQVAGALDAAHGQGVVHGNLKPSDLLIDDEGAIQVSDFGLAALLAERIAVPGRDRHLYLAGSAGYMAPEVAVTGRPSPAADIYALGVMLFEMLTGQHPYQIDEATTALQAIWAHARQPVPRVTELRPELPPAVDALVEKALAKSPQDRFSSAGEMAARFRKATPPADAFPVPVGVQPGRERTRLLKGAVRDVRPASAVGEAAFDLPNWVLGLGLVIGLSLVGWVISLVISSWGGPRVAGLSPSPTLPAMPTRPYLPPMPWEAMMSPQPIPTLLPLDTTTPWPTTTPFPSETLPAGQPSPDVTRRPRATQPKGNLTPGPIFTLGVILPQTPGAGLNPPVALSADAILFVRGAQIFAINPDGSGLTQLTAAPGRDFGPSWSPDRTHIAFTSDRDGNMEIYLMAVDAEQKRLTSHLAADMQPAWAWQGGVLAFSSARDGSAHIYTMRSDGSSLTRVTSGPASDTLPSWSPVGGRIVFASNRDGGDFDLFVINANGSGLAQLTQNAVDDVWPDWSPDGARIAYVSGGDVYVLTVGGAQSTRLTTVGNVQGVAWSPDGGRIVYSAGGDLWIIGAGGGAPVALTSGPALDSDPAWAR